MAEWLDTISEITNAEMTEFRGVEIIGTKRIAVIRTSDRISFKRCRRRWGWQSHLRQNLEPMTVAAPLWFGSGVHFVLEDFHGLQQFGSDGTGPSSLLLAEASRVADNALLTSIPTNTPSTYRASVAFTHYVRATYKQDKTRLPDEWRDITPMAIAMMDYYQYTWLHYRDPLTTFVYEGKPQVEVNFRIPIPFDASHWDYDEVVYSGTLDRIIIDEHGSLWIVEYKTAKALYQLHYQVDSQISAYIWAARHIYPNHHIAGVIYQQHLKDYPEGPRIIANGGVSVAKSNMRTSWALYRDTLLKIYGSPPAFPAHNVDYLNSLAKAENTEALYARDCFVRRDPVERNEFSSEVESEKILMEVEDMLNPDLPLYPNPTRDCPHLCPFLGACVSFDDGSDWEYVIQHDFRQRQPVYDSWREYLPGGSKWQ